MNRSKIIRKFEKFIFQGVPERPESTFERNDYASFTVRHTARSISTLNQDTIEANSTVLGCITEDIQSRTEIYHRI